MVKSALCLEEKEVVKEKFSCWWDEAFCGVCACVCVSVRARVNKLEFLTFLHSHSGPSLVHAMSPIAQSWPCQFFLYIEPPRLHVRSDSQLSQNQTFGAKSLIWMLAGDGTKMPTWKWKMSMQESYFWIPTPKLIKSGTWVSHVASLCFSFSRWNGSTLWLCFEHCTR